MIRRRTRRLSWTPTWTPFSPMPVDTPAMPWNRSSLDLLDLPALVDGGVGEAFIAGLALDHALDARLRPRLVVEDEKSDDEVVHVDAVPAPWMVPCGGAVDAAAARPGVHERPEARPLP